MRSEDLVPLLASKPSQSVGLRQGVVLTWDSATGENTIDVGGATMENLTFLSDGTVPNYVTDDVVILLTFGSTWAVLGKFVTPA
jgi:hypothetical protein